MHRFRLQLQETAGFQLLSEPAEVAIQVVDNGNRPPQVSAGEDPQAPQVIEAEHTLSAVASDPDGDPLTWRWMQTEGTPVPLIGWDGANPRFTPHSVGRYTFRVFVSDGQVASLPDEVSLVVKRHGADNHAPSAAIDGPENAEKDQPITLDGSRSADVDPYDRLKFQWYVVAMPTGKEPALGSPAATATTFTASAPGDYTVRLTVSDGDLWSAPVFHHIHVPALASQSQPCGCHAGSGEPLVAAVVLALGLRKLRSKRGGARRSGSGTR
jgi:hypothetical protein